MTSPRVCTASEAPSELLDLAARLMSLVLAGDHATCAVLRQQYAVAEVSTVELTGAGFFVTFSVPPGAPRAEPPDLAGGDVKIALEGVRHGAGCVLFVRGGVIDTLEGYTYGEPWPDHLGVTALTDTVCLGCEALPSR